MTGSSPNIVVIAGPNGAGKSTAAPAILRDTTSVYEFVNADVIAHGLSGFDPQGAAIAAGRVMLRRLSELATQRVDFAFETTLASQRLATWLRRLAAEDYLVHIFFFWLPNAEMAIARVRQRTRLGGHSVPAEAVARRYVRGVKNFFQVYRPLAATWRVYDNSTSAGALLVARGAGKGAIEILDELKWKQVQLSWQSQGSAEHPRDLDLE